MELLFIYPHVNYYLQKFACDSNHHLLVSLLMAKGFDKTRNSVTHSNFVCALKSDSISLDYLSVDICNKALYGLLTSKVQLLLKCHQNQHLMFQTNANDNDTSLCYQYVGRHKTFTGSQTDDLLRSIQKTQLNIYPLQTLFRISPIKQSSYSFPESVCY